MSEINVANESKSEANADVEMPPEAEIENASKLIFRTVISNMVEKK